MSSLFSEIFERSMGKKELIGIWKYDDENSFICGYVVNYDETLVAIKHYTEYGKPDGVMVEQISNIINIDINDDYLISLQYIINNSKKLDKENEIDIDFSGGEMWQFKILQENSERKDRIVSLEINRDESFSGFIGKVTVSDFMLKRIGKLGEDEGSVVYRVEDVTSLSINDQDCRKRLMLYNWKNSLTR
ncbi:MAG: hypothetical protein H0W61_13935 [Bacteroidetes bacterium]|nr:hypothetical protein [Bacteroidota bacterium]